jgi:hypothetical protein
MGKSHLLHGLGWLFKTRQPELNVKLFSSDEFILLRSKPFIIPVHLGKNILRADTAAIAALSLVQALHGNWGARDS